MISDAKLAKNIFINAIKEFAKDGKHRIIAMISALEQEYEE